MKSTGSRKRKPKRFLCPYGQWKRTKGVREYQLVINYFLTLDHLRGATYSQLARLYKLDAANIYKRVNGILNAEKVTNNGKQPFKRNPSIERDIKTGRFTIRKSCEATKQLGNSF